MERADAEDGAVAAVRVALGPREGAAPDLDRCRLRCRRLGGDGGLVRAGSGPAQVGGGSRAGDVGGSLTERRGGGRFHRAVQRRPGEDGAGEDERSEARRDAAAATHGVLPQGERFPYVPVGT